MATNLAELVNEKRADILALAAKHGARNVRIFGSVARGDADEQSDIDFLVEFDLDRSIFDHAALLLDLQNILGCRVDVVNERGIKPHLRERVLTEAIPL